MWTELLRLEVPGVPVAQPRQRHVLIGGHVRNYTPSDHPVRMFKATLRLAAQQAGPPELWIGPLAVEIDCYLPRPKSMMRRKDPDGPVPCYIGKDWDNLGKAVTDALTGILWHDDRQIWDGRVRKMYHEKAGTPRCVIRVLEASA